MIRFLARLWIKDSRNFSAPNVRQAYAKLCSGIGIFLNILLFILKFICGTISHSTAMLADAFNNLADVITLLASFLGFLLAGIEAGPHHPFGHGRYEWLMSLFSSIAVVIMGVALAQTAWRSIRTPASVAFSPLIGLVLVCSILAKLYMFVCNSQIAAKIDSSAMKATAADSISDMASTAAILVSMLIQRLTGWMVDGWCGLFVSVFIMLSGFKAAAETMERILGQSPDQQLIDQIMETVHQYPEIQRISDLTVHDYGLGRLAISMHIAGADHKQRLQLQAAGSNITYELYRRFHCHTTIQVDILDTSEQTARMVTSLVNAELARLDLCAELKQYQVVLTPGAFDVVLTIGIPRRQQKREQEIRQAMEQAFFSAGPQYRAAIRFVIAAMPNQKKQ